MGTIVWTDATQPANSAQWLCAGYVVTEADGNFTLVVSDPDRHAWIYIKDNGALHPNNGLRVFGGSSEGNTLAGYPVVHVEGRPFERTWSLLSKTSPQGSSNISLQHDVSAMGWRKGDRIALAPIQPQSTGEGRTYYIQDITGNQITLASDAQYTLTASTDQEHLGTVANHKQAEVMVLTRNIVITGDDFKNVPCEIDSPICPCQLNLADATRGIDTSRVCTVGLHTVVNGSTGIYNIQYTRVEKCGQRAFTGRYCIHFHYMKACNACIAHGNAVEFGQQRGIVVHETHTATVTENTVYDIRGAGIYIEDGNELYNHIEYNAVICPWKFLDPVMGGCTIPMTDNQDADDANNQASYWSLDHTNHFIGNRASNSFNGLFFDPSMKNQGRGGAENKICTQWTRLGRVQGNTCHGHMRFGTYFVSNNYPRQLPTTIAGNGLTNYEPIHDICDTPFAADGSDLGQSSTIMNNVDYDNVFVGAYAMGDIQFRDHFSLDNANLIYHKETKNFQDGCSSHYKNYHFEFASQYGNGALNLPAGYGTVIFENSTFKGHLTLNPSMDCGTATGVICNPQYILEHPNWEVTSDVWVNWAATTFNPAYGGVFNLAPNTPSVSALLPAGYQGFVNGMHDYLLDLDSGNTCKTSTQLGVDTQFNNAILCTKPLRRLEVYTHDLNTSTAGTMELLVTQNGNLVTTGTLRFVHQSDAKQGFSIPIVATLDYHYELTHNNGPVNNTWSVDFSDPVIGNRYGVKDQIYLQVRGRTCPTAITTSQHDRRFLYATASDAFGLNSYGHGACSGYPDMPDVDCAAKGDIELMNCPGNCTNCDGPNQYCDCRDSAGVCMCKPGFFGPACQNNICDAARCGSHGTCTAQFLGGDLWVADAACACEAPWTGPTCEFNPCSGQTCNGKGTCQANGESDYNCQCDPGYYGKDCQYTCEGKCTNQGGQFGDNGYGCGANPTTKAWCYMGPGGGCAMGETLPYDAPNWCCYANCNATCTTPCQDALNDCHAPGYCAGASCVASLPRPNGWICHSTNWGACRDGECVAGDPPSSSSSSSVSSSSSSSTSSISSSTSSSTSSTSSTTSSTSSTSTSSTSSTSTFSATTDIVVASSSSATAASSTTTAATTGTPATSTSTSGTAGQSTTGCGVGLYYCPGNQQCFNTSAYVCGTIFPYLCPTGAPHFCYSACSAASC